MRYIRTKYNTIEDLDKIDFDAALTRETFVKYNAFKQADTIEKLCDRFVVIYENEEPVPYKNYLDAIATQKEVYGAIWTDKGLIYVAKMKGVLPNGEIDWELL